MIFFSLLSTLILTLILIKGGAKMISIFFILFLLTLIIILTLIKGGSEK